jgi:glycosyltransferase involved in cell wall biosynthesis
MISPPKVSVIVPFYMMEEYIETCAKSLFDQTLEDIEFIFVNDCSPDNSENILTKVIEEYSHRKDQIKIINHSVNKGVSASRNSGLAEATGDFIIHCDSDDWVDHGMYEDLYTKAIEGSYDITWCDYYIERRGITIHKIQNCPENKEACIKAMLCNRNLSTYLVDKLVRRDLYINNSISFPEGINIREDFLVLIQLFYFSASVARITGAYYHYRHRADSISRNEGEFDRKDFYIRHRLEATNRIAEFLKQQNAFEIYQKEIMCAKLILKRLILSNTKKTEKWTDLYPESDRFIFSTGLPKLFKLMLWAASIGNVPLVNLSKNLLIQKNNLSESIRRLLPS